MALELFAILQSGDELPFEVSPMATVDEALDILKNDFKIEAPVLWYQQERLLPSDLLADKGICPGSRIEVRQEVGEFAPIAERGVQLVPEHKNWIRGTGQGASALALWSVGFSGPDKPEGPDKHYWRCHIIDCGSAFLRFGLAIGNEIGLNATWNVTRACLIRIGSGKSMDTCGPGSLGRTLETGCEGRGYEGKIITFALDRKDGSLKVYFDGEPLGELFKGIPIDKPLYPLVGFCNERATVALEPADPIDA